MSGTTVVVAVLNEGETLTRLIEALGAQSLVPGEVVIADGGSTDGSRERLELLQTQHPFNIRVLSVPGNISRGRNAAIEAAAYPIIAVTDAGCVPSVNWLQALAEPIIARDSEAVAGGYRAVPQTEMERAIAVFTWVPLSRRTKHFLPSHRSIAFTKELWRRIGGYDESLDAGEDTLFDLRVEELGSFTLAPDAVVDWRPRGTLAAAVRQQLFYGTGDGRARTQWIYHGVVAALISMEICIFCPDLLIRGCASLAVATAFAFFIRKDWSLFGMSFRPVPLIAALLLVLPIARLTGFVLGLGGLRGKALFAKS